MALRHVAGAAIALFILASAAHAQTIEVHTFTASLDQGGLAGTRFPVTFSYDADQVVPVGQSFVPLLSFDFTLGSVTFTRTDISQGGQAIFTNGILENVTASFQGVLPPDAPVSNVTFGFGGPGVIGYIDRNGEFGHGTFTLDSIGWVSSDVGQVRVGGSAVKSDGIWTIRGGGTDIWASADSFHFLYRTTHLPAGRVVVRIDDLENTNAYAKSGLMLRAAAAGHSAEDPAAPTVILDMKPSGEIEFMARATYGADMVYWAGAWAAAPAWLRLDWSGADGGSILAFTSQDNVTWTPVGGIAFSIPERWDVGVAVTSHAGGQLTTSHVEGLSVTPIAWTNVDIGAPGLTGSAVGEHDGSTSFVIDGAGADIWGTADAFHFTFKDVTGGAVVEARVRGEQAADQFAKVGIMFRDGLAPDAPFVMLDMKPNGEVEFMQRPSAGEAVVYLGGRVVGLYSWMRLVRDPRDISAITAEVSLDGLSWTIVGRASVSMAPATRVGIAVTSHDSTATSTAVVDQVSVVQLTGTATVTFNGLTMNAGSVSSYAESGVVVSSIAGSWVTSTTFGNPAPFIQFIAPAGTSIPGQVRVTAGGSLFFFSAIDLYSSTTPIPYAITGFRASSVVFTITGTLPNTFGQFRTVVSPYFDTIDALSIELTNAPAPCCANPMGIDNLVLGRDVP